MSPGGATERERSSASIVARSHRYAKDTVPPSRRVQRYAESMSPLLRITRSTPCNRYAESIVTRSTPLRGAHRSAEQTMPSFRGSPSLRKAIVIPSTPFHRYAKSIVTRSTPCHRYAKHTVTWSTPYHRSAKSIVTRSTPCQRYARSIVTRSTS